MQKINLSLIHGLDEIFIFKGVLNSVPKCLEDHRSLGTSKLEFKKMNVKEAVKKLALARKREARVRLEIKRLRAFLLDRGIDISHTAAIRKRNQTIYDLHLAGNTDAEIAGEFKLDTQRVRVIYGRIAFLAKHKK